MLTRRLGLGIVLTGSLLSTALAGIPPVVGSDTRYTTAKGDTLYSVAKKAHLAIEHVAFANGLSVEAQLPAKKQLLIPTRRILPREHPRTGLLVNLPERGVYLFKDDHFINFYPVAIGEPGFRTPQGKFKIVSMAINPTWLPPEWAGKGEVVVKAGPDNPLGDRWIGISAPGIGFHVAQDPRSVGANASHGCMRMYPGMVHELFKQVHKGMPVWIVYEPVKFGLDPATSLVEAQIFPDVYKENTSAQKGAKILKEMGLTQRVSQPVLQGLYKKPTGTVKPVEFKGAWAPGAKK